MRFIQLTGMSIRTDCQVAFQQWVAANEERIKATYPSATEFGGVYAAVFTTEKDAGDFFWVEYMDSYSRLDELAAAAKDPHGEMVRLQAEMAQFMDPDRTAPWSRILLKSTADATITDVPTH